MSAQGTLIEGVNPTARRDDDFYRTPAFQVRMLLRRYPIAPSRLVFECCAGDGAIANLLVADVMTNDVVVREPLLPNFTLDATRAESWMAFNRRGPIDIVITNPPFNLAFPIIQHAIDAAREAVIMLLRLSWLEPTKERSEWLAYHPPSRLIVLPRHDYRGNGKTDSVTSAWMIWEKSTRFRHVDVVGLAERDALIAEGVR